MPLLRLGADSGRWPPLAINEPYISGNPGPARLPVPPTLADELRAWGDIYEAALNQEYWPDSGFLDEEAAPDWLHSGADLAARLTTLLERAGDRVEYAYADAPAAFLRETR